MKQGFLLALAHWTVSLVLQTLMKYIRFEKHAEWIINSSFHIRLCTTHFSRGLKLSLQAKSMPMFWPSGHVLDGLATHACARLFWNNYLSGPKGQTRLWKKTCVQVPLDPGTGHIACTSTDSHPILFALVFGCFGYALGIVARPTTHHCLNADLGHLFE